MLFLRKNSSSFDGKNSARITICDSLAKDLNGLGLGRDIKSRTLLLGGLLYLVSPLLSQLEKEYSLTKSEALDYAFDAINKLQGRILHLVYVEIIRTMGVLKIGENFKEPEIEEPTIQMCNELNLSVPKQESFAPEDNMVFDADLESLEL